MSKQHLSTQHSLCHHSNRMADMVKTTLGTVGGTMTIIMAAGPRAMEGF
ncbi:hypothetical protein GCM10027343_42850 [Noviherbaspirillum agri]